MKLLTLSGSTRPTSSTVRLLKALALSAPQFEWTEAPSLDTLPLFTPARLSEGKTASCAVLAKAVQEADVVVIATPEYAHNMPAALKNALEWCVASGEFSQKRVIAITSTPNAPRGERCMQSLQWTLLALDAIVLVEVPIYGAAKGIDEALVATDPEIKDTLEAIVELLVDSSAA
ncbi:MAG: NADPH-dependent FMN reductase [Saprospiraceae bacterium]